MPPFDWWGPMWFPIFPILFMVLGLVFCFFMMTKMMGRHGPRSSWQEDTLAPHQRAIDILNERYAKGEIDKTEYEEKRRVIS